jgi:hypothetical protein
MREAEAMCDDAGLAGVSGSQAVSYAQGFSAACEFICHGISWSILLMG